MEISDKTAQDLLNYLCGSYGLFGQYIPETSNRLIDELSTYLYGEPLIGKNDA